MEDLKLERQIAPLPPVVLGGLLVVPAGLIAAMTGRTAGGGTNADRHSSRRCAGSGHHNGYRAETRLRTDRSGARETRLRYQEPRARHGQAPIPGGKGAGVGADTITVTKNEILYSLNKPDDFVLAIVEFLGDGAHRAHYVRRPFQREPDFGVTSVNYNFAELIGRAAKPS